MVGPGATWSNGTLLPSVETTVEYILKVIRKIQRESIKSMATKQEALDDIFAHMDELHKTTVWGEECRSWFKDGKKEGRIYIWPGSVCHTHLCLSVFDSGNFTDTLKHTRPFIFSRQ